MTKISIKYVAEMDNGEYLFTMYDNTGYSAFTVLDFAEANFYDSPDDELLFQTLGDIKSGKIRLDMGSGVLKRVVKVEMRIR